MNEGPESRPEVLEAWHEKQGVRWRDRDGRPVAAGYRDAVSEANALRKGCGLIERRWTESMQIAGEDRQRFLNGYLTCELSKLEAGSAAYGFFVSAQGRILSDAVITVCGEALRLEVPAGRAAPLVEHLSRYIIADRVALSVPNDSVDLLVVGPLAAQSITGPAVDLNLTSWATGETRIGDVEVSILTERSLGVPVFRLAMKVDGAAAVAEELASRGVVPVGFDALDALRIEAGVPRYGADFDDAHFPQETGLEDAVSYTKGCYLGQEVVARIHYRGHVNHQLRAVRIAGDSAPTIGAIIRLENQEVGKLGSLTFSETVGQFIGLTIIHRKAAAIGQVVDIAGGHEGRVEEPGFVAARDSTAV